MAQRVMDALFVPDGKTEDAPYKGVGMHAIRGKRGLDELCIVSNFVEVFLAREGHSHPVGINYLEKIQLPHLPSLYGAMLAGVAQVIAGVALAIVNVCVAEPEKLEPESVAVTAYEPAFMGAVADGP